MFFLMLNYLTDDAEHSRFEGYHKKTTFYYSRAITQTKTFNRKNDKTAILLTKKCRFYYNTCTSVCTKKKDRSEKDFKEKQKICYAIFIDFQCIALKYTGSYMFKIIYMYTCTTR